MDEAGVVLQQIHDEVSKQASRIVGRLDLVGDTMTVLNGTANVRVEMQNELDSPAPVVHCHVIAELAEHGEPLEACVTGIHPDRRRKALAGAARVWIRTVASPLFSLLHARPVMDAAHFDGSDPWGVAGCHGFVGPMRARLFDEVIDPDLFLDAPLFDYVAEMAPPGLVHLAKVTVEAHGPDGWNRTLEVDDHSAVHGDHAWECDRPAPAHGIASQFAVFHYGGDPGFVQRRQQIDDAIRQFVAAFKHTDDLDQVEKMLLADGLDVGLLDRLTIFAPLAFCRVILEETGISVSPEYVRITRAGDVEEGLKLMHEPVFARALALSLPLMHEELDAVKRAAITSGEFGVVNEAMRAGDQPQDFRLLPPVTTERGVSDDATERADRELQRRAERQHGATRQSKPWWKFW